MRKKVFSFDYNGLVVPFCKDTIIFYLCKAHIYRYVTTEADLLYNLFS